MPPWASMESHSSSAPLESMMMSAVRGRFNAAYSPATPQPTISTSHERSDVAAGCAGRAPGAATGSRWSIGAP